MNWISGRCQLEKIRRARRLDARRLAAKNVNELVQQISQEMKAAKPWVQFGISPFGIWRPQNPPPIKGLDAYGKIYADARLWLANGWVDFSRRSFTGPSRRVNKVFPCCSTGGARKTRKAAMSSPRWMTPLSVKNFRRMKSHGRFRTFARRRASAAKFITICAISRTMPRSPPPCNRNMPSRRLCRLRRGWIPRRRKNRRCLLPRKIPSR